MGCITIYICIYVCIMYVYSIHIWGGVPVREDSHTGQPEFGAQPCEANCSHSDWDLLPLLVAYCSYTISGWWFGTFGLLFHILGRIIPTDEVIFFRGLAQPPTSRCANGWVFLVCYLRQLSWPQGFTSAINEFFPPEKYEVSNQTWLAGHQNMIFGWCACKRCGFSRWFTDLGRYWPNILTNSGWYLIVGGWKESLNTIYQVVWLDMVRIRFPKNWDGFLQKLQVEICASRFLQPPNPIVCHDILHQLCNIAINYHNLGAYPRLQYMS